MKCLRLAREPGETEPRGSHAVPGAAGRGSWHGALTKPSGGRSHRRVSPLRCRYVVHL